ncbi:MAG TPA: hypothetical protein PKE21_13750 [Flavobacteriales bacterium]|nr:hypothetical protein [Flavobacteriales bacterium]HMR28541.1 hypothetical protein [Flavobacteriales bacterium]
MYAQRDRLKQAAVLFMVFCLVFAVYTTARKFWRGDPVQQHHVVVPPPRGR